MIYHNWIFSCKKFLKDFRQLSHTIHNNSNKMIIDLDVRAKTYSSEDIDLRIIKLG